MIVIVMRRGNKRLRLYMTTVTSSAAHRRLCIRHSLNVVLVDVRGHFDHQPRGFLLRFGIVREIQRRAAVRHFAIRIDGVAGTAFCAEFSRPLVHQLMNLFARHRLWQHFEIGGRGLFVVMRIPGRVLFA